MPSLVSRFLDTNGDGTGSKEQAAPAAKYYIQPGPDAKYSIARMIVSYQDSVNWSPTKYANQLALTNGIQVYVEDDDGILYYLSDPDYPIKQNTNWSDLCYDFTLFNFGQGDDVCSVRWTFARSGRPVMLDGKSNQRLVVMVNDDLSLLTTHKCKVQGYVTTGYN